MSDLKKHTRDKLFSINLLIVFCLPIGAYYLSEDRAIETSRKVIAFCFMAPLGLLMMLVYAYLIAYAIVAVIGPG